MLKQHVFLRDVHQKIQQEELQTKQLMPVLRTKVSQCTCSARKLGSLTQQKDSAT